MTTQSVVTRIRHLAGAYRQRVNVPDQSQQVDVRIDQQGVIALLEQVSELAGAPMHAAGILTAESLHEPPDRHVGNLQDQMDRV